MPYIITEEKKKMYAERQKLKYQTDPEYRARCRIQAHIRYLKHREAWLERSRLYRARIRSTVEGREKIRAQKRADYRNHRDQRRALLYQRRLVIRHKLFEVYGKVCACCGEKNEHFLTLDHVNGGGNREYRESSPTAVYARAIRNVDHAKYRILCFNCNMGRVKGNGVCPHVASPITPAFVNRKKPGRKVQFPLPEFTVPIPYGEPSLAIGGATP